MRILKYTLLCFFALLWLAALNAHVFELAAKADIVHDGYQYGDLYRLVNLPQFKDPKKDCAVYQASPFPGNNRKINLFIIGDSFTEPERISKENFPVHSYYYIRRDQKLYFKSDTTVVNILMIECVEREFRGNFGVAYRNLAPAASTYIGKPESSSLMNELDRAFAASAADDRFHMLLFQNDLILKLKEWKATFNQNIFGRVGGNVQLVKDGKEIVYYPDVDTPQKTSSFSTVSDGEIDTLVNNIGEIRRLAKNMGFDEVILSIIPNKVSVVMPEYGVYNHLIERIYAHPRLEVPVVDVLSDFRHLPTRAYRKGDSHWTCEAQQVWIDKTNHVLYDIVTSNKTAVK